jgi:hypothetical protein
MKKNEMGEASCTYGFMGGAIEGFVGNNWGKETTWKTYA